MPKSRSRLTVPLRPAAMAPNYGGFDGQDTIGGYWACGRTRDTDHPNLRSADPHIRHVDASVSRAKMEGEQALLDEALRRADGKQASPPISPGTLATGAELPPGAARVVRREPRLHPGSCLRRATGGNAEVISPLWAKRAS